MTLKSDDFGVFLSECDGAIRAGQISTVAARLKKLNLAQVERRHRLGLARLCRRTGLITAGLKLLAPMVRKLNSLDADATPAEVCEYSVLLSRLGLAKEALGLLSGVNSDQAPEAELFRGFCHIITWDYELAVGPLENFIKISQDAYLTQIARVNLASSYVATGRFLLARALLDQLIDELKSRNAMRLVGNCLELRAQTHFHGGHIDTCQVDLVAALKIFAATSSYDQLLVNKWHAYLEAIASKSAAPLLKFRADAVKREHWESVRDADLFALKISFDQKQFDHLYFGTPFAAYRERILREVNGRPGMHYDFGGTNFQTLNLQTGETQGLKVSRPTKKVYQMMAVLLKDFYQPSRVGSLFSDLYPNEYFDVHSSPLRVRQCMRRLRRWIESNHLPVQITTAKGAFRITSQGSFAIRVPGTGVVHDHSLDAERLRILFAPGRTFQVAEAIEQLGFSHSSFHRLIERLIASGEIERSGRGKSTRYSLISSIAREVKSAA